MQALGILGLCLSPNLQTHLGATAHISWQNLDNVFGQLGISAIYVDFQAAIHLKVSKSQNLQVEMQRMLTLFEHLPANGMQLSDPIQGMILLSTLPQKWDGISMVYLQGQQALANITFAAVRDAIMAEFEWTSHPSTLMVQKLSAIKRKGKSPNFTEQLRSTNKPPASSKALGSVPGEAAPKKKRRRGKKVKVHTIVSSALIPELVAKCIQESHHVVPSMAAPTPTYTSGTVVGGPSHAPANIPTIIASFNSSDIPYQKVEPVKMAQAFTGFTGQPSPNTYAKAVVEK